MPNKDRVLSMAEFKGTETNGHSELTIDELLIKMKLELPQQLQLVAIFAKIQKAKYDALVKAGFSKQDALYLTR